MKVLDRNEAMARVGGDLELLREIAALFQEECPPALEILRTAIAKGDGVAASRAAHGLKGSASNFGALPAVNAAIKIEQLAREGRIGESQPELDRLDSALNRLMQELSEI